MSNWRAREKENIRKLKAYADALEKKERDLTNLLSDLARGVGREVLGRDWDVAMKRYAAEELARISLIRIPPRPYL